MYTDVLHFLHTIYRKLTIQKNLANYIPSESRHLMAAPILLSLKFLCLWSFTFVYLDSVCYYRVCEWFVHVFSVVLRLYLGANISY
jgi:hypothetical protein